MRAATENTLVRYTPAGLITAVRSGGIRYPFPTSVTASAVTQTLDGANGRSRSARRRRLRAGKAAAGSGVRDGGCPLPLGVRDGRRVGAAVARRGASHGIDDEAAHLLDVRDEEGSLARRARRLDEAVIAYRTSRTEPGAATRQPVAAALAPAHDLVSVTVHERIAASRLAFRLGGERDFDKLDIDHLRRFADGVGTDPEAVAAMVESTVDALRRTWPAVLAEHPVPGFLARYIGDRLDRLPLTRR